MNHPSVATTGKTWSHRSPSITNAPNSSLCPAGTAAWPHLQHQQSEND